MKNERISTTDVGRIGEYLTAYYLESFGVECTIVDRRGSDIWCKFPNGSLVSLEVKSARTEWKSGKGPDYFKFKTDKKNCDWFAFVNLKNESIIFQKKSDLTTSESYFRVDDMTPDTMKHSVSAFLDANACEEPHIGAFSLEPSPQTLN